MFDHGEIYALGYAYGLLVRKWESVYGDRPNGKISSPFAINFANSRPLAGFTRAHMAMLANKLIDQDLVDELAEVLSHVNVPDRNEQCLSIANQGTWQLGYYAATSAEKTPFVWSAPKGHGIARARKSLGLSQESVAEKCGCTQKDVSRWERGEHSPSPEKLKLLAEVLECRMEDLV